ncbi:MAG: hypothetical protein WKF61_02240 [Luteimonas sp.]
MRVSIPIILFLIVGGGFLCLTALEFFDIGGYVFALFFLCAAGLLWLMRKKDLAAEIDANIYKNVGNKSVVEILLIVAALIILPKILNWLMTA